MDHIAYISIGSNLGPKLENCERAIEKLKLHESICVEAISKWRETEALTVEDERQPAYINGTVKISTNLWAYGLLKTLKKVETEMGREPLHSRWSARTIDLDILFFDDLVVAESDLQIPHPEIEKRKFVLEPLCDIEPGLVHPVLKKEVRALLNEAGKR